VKGLEDGMSVTAQPGALAAGELNGMVRRLYRKPDFDLVKIVLRLLRLEILLYA
jgi:hypothetical protein